MTPDDIIPVPETTTAITVRDRELAEAREQLVKAERKYHDGGAGGKLGGIGLVVGLLGGGILLACVLPIVPVIGNALFFGGTATLAIGTCMNVRAERKLKAAKKKLAALENAHQPDSAERPVPKIPDVRDTPPVPA